MLSSQFTLRTPNADTNAESDLRPQLHIPQLVADTKDAMLHAAKLAFIYERDCDLSLPSSQWNEQHWMAYLHMIRAHSCAETFQTAILRLGPLAADAWHDVLDYRQNVLPQTQFYTLKVGERLETFVDWNALECYATRQIAESGATVSAWIGGEYIATWGPQA